MFSSLWSPCVLQSRRGQCELPTPLAPGLGHRLDTHISLAFACPVHPSQPFFSMTKKTNKISPVRSLCKAAQSPNSLVWGFL